MTLDPLSPLQGGEGIGRIPGIGGSDGSSPVRGAAFKKFLLDSLDQVNRMQQESEAAQEALATGRTDDITGVMNAVEKADIAVQTVMAVRNKLIEAYQEVLRMQI
ncbi:MAG: flagellar hook-basal body complex protein FliE [Planctomycetota bacterium]